MTDNNTIPIPVTIEGKEFYADRTDKALKALVEERYTPLFMHQLADARIQAPKDSVLWKNWYTTPSIRATGTTKQGSKIVVYAHIPNCYSNPDNITREIEKNRLVNGAGILPRKEFQRLVDLDESKDNLGNRLVWTVDYDTLRKSPSEVIPVEQALEHPQTIPFLGGEERARRYLERHKEVFGKQIRIRHSDDLKDEPLARPLFAGSAYCYGDLGGGNDFGSLGRFVGVRADGARSKTGRASPPKILRPSLEQILKLSSGFVPDVARGEFKERVEALYSK